MKIGSGGRPAPGDPQATKTAEWAAQNCRTLAYREIRRLNAWRKDGGDTTPIGMAVTTWEHVIRICSEAHVKQTSGILREGDPLAIRAEQLTPHQTALAYAGAIDVLMKYAYDSGHYERPNRVVLVLEQLFADGQAHGRAERIEPLKRSDDPEQDEVFRMNVPAGYLLMTPEAYQMDMRVAQTKEREACAKIAEGCAGSIGQASTLSGVYDAARSTTAKKVAAAIRDQETR